MRKGFPIYEKMRKYLVVYEEGLPNIQYSIRKCAIILSYMRKPVVVNA
jgi:hypothetical protein